ncbi:uncharacterized protein LOC119095252 [Pollicipes pollicipes]|uniref:uncharacterized protein LOC119095252 n=1 Tax=Pollicipes pollicipes TaxID=41117 RepID=UPI001884EE4A|nr:uncharacterized protein LOC119095252 [Pollicipes pollicipes]
MERPVKEQYPWVTSDRRDYSWRGIRSKAFNLVSLLLFLWRASAFYVLYVTRQLLDQALNLLFEWAYRRPRPPLPPPRQSLLRLSVSQLADKIRARQLTSELPRFAEALAEARAADAEIALLHNQLLAETQDAHESDRQLLVGPLSQHAEDLRLVAQIMAHGPVAAARLRETVPVAQLRVLRADLPALLASVVPCGQSGAGLPLAVQAVAAPGADHLCLAAAEALRDEWGAAEPVWAAVETGDSPPGAPAS